MKTKDFKYLFAANLMFAVHVGIVFVILFGWYFQSLYWIYLITLIGTLLSELILGYCLFTKWEFDLRKKVDPSLDYDYAFVSYYAYKFVGINVPGKYIRYPAIIFLAISLILLLI